MGSPIRTSGALSDLRALALRQFDAAAEVMGLDANLRRILRAPKRIFAVQVPIEMAQALGDANLVNLARHSRPSSLARTRQVMAT